MTTNADRHIFLYAKGHYETGNLLDDMKKIIGKRCCCDPKYISTNDIYIVLASIVWNYIDNEDKFLDFISKLNPEGYWMHGHLAETNKQQAHNYFNRALIASCLFILRFQKVKDIPFELGKPDSNILPLKIKENTNDN